MKSHKNRGMYLEGLINKTNMYYLENNIALIFKKPTPIQIVNVEYNKRSLTSINKAFFKLPSTTDYNGLYNGYYLDFECKETISKTSFSQNYLKPHQYNHLKNVIKHNGIAFLIIYFSSHDEVYVIRFIDYINYLEEENRKSIPYIYFKEKGLLVKKTNIIDYLPMIIKLFNL